ncbi:hypothetical protein C0V72_11440 [Porphyrobacter sp. TH134]|uniref:hypothetical protein n=1 Tax=Porphyrobacter sp. TH134 TaxID=2067450 RepID=UPI000C7C76F3|nr:hypothetical protein [Porphyrobacter sp. TH134]PLK23119.1 hypothetical protein C0V72_11440 [Porphyrobacter sp. TH134]
MTSRTSTLIFIYNADGGVLDALGDMVHKIVSPATYPCSLCALTYGPVAMRGAWRRFLKRLGLPTLFLYRDEFRGELDRRDLALPAVLLGGDGEQPEIFVSAQELAALPDLAALMALIEMRIAARA